MAEPYLGEIRMFAGNFAPAGWAFCNGQLLSISSNTALFSLLGTQYGGNGTSTFALPNMQANTPMCQGNGPGLTQRVIGEIGGEVNHTVIVGEMPAHNHALNVDFLPGATGQASGNYVGAGFTRQSKVFAPAANSTPLAANIVSPSGGSQAHSNQQPYQVLTFIIATQGIYPARQ